MSVMSVMSAISAVLGRGESRGSALGAARGGCSPVFAFCCISRAAARFVPPPLRGSASGRSWKPSEGWRG